MLALGYLVLLWLNKGIVIVIIIIIIIIIITNIIITNPSFLFLERRNSVIYQVAIATVIFSLVKTSCFRAKGLWHFIGGYPVICTFPPADISEQGEKNLTVPFSRGSWERNACRSPTTSFQGLFSYKLEALRLSPKMASRFFIFLE